ncbi:MAG: transcription-repair coupling factor [Candidatus Omnitrophota bacterium]
MFDLLKLYLNQTIEIEQVIAYLVKIGYSRTAQISQKAEFALHGGMLDVYPVNYDHPVRIELGDKTIETIRSFNFITGKTIFAQNIVIILPRKLFIKKFVLKSQKILLDKSTDLNIGDYLVHLEHGIARFCGMEKIKVKKGYRKHFVLEYAGGDKLYVPLSQTYLLQKYIAFIGRAPKLHKLGTKVWQKTKERIALRVNCFAHDLLKVQVKRLTQSGFGFSKDSDWQKEFERNFPYEETPDQKSAAAEVKADMENSRPMDRLLCGDVGYGKTEIAFRAAFKAVMNNKQAVMLVPTTILAEQHYTNFIERIKEYPLNLVMLSRFKTWSEQKDIIRDIREGRADIVIGTHRLLSEDIKFKNLGLVIIDEEQRFGVRAKEKLKHLRELVDVLTLTATPIPRTLYLSLAGVRDMSIINTPPKNRTPIETFVVPDDSELIADAVHRELGRRGQVYFVHNRIYDIDRVAGRLKNIIPEAEIAAAHGQMPEKTLEKIMREFINGKINLLVATTIIESGLDIPNVNTIFVDQADTYGLADLYQLRGRVGRFNRNAYAYFIIPRNRLLTPDAKRRLCSIEKFTALGSGFRIAMEDLEIRGAGNILGEQQHGYIQAVGFDLYCQMLENAVKQQRKGIDHRL